MPDGANISFIHLMSECVNEEVRIGQRVTAIWKPKEEWDFAMDNIRYFKPLDEPDVPVELIGLYLLMTQINLNMDICIVALVNQLA